MPRLALDTHRAGPAAAQGARFARPPWLVLTTTTDEARPQFQANYTWNLAPSFNDAAFTFNAAATANRIPLNGLPAAAGADR